MLKIIRESFKLTNSNIVIATPLIFFSIISSLYLIFSSGGSIIGLVFSAVLFFLMLGAFLSGWFYMIANVVREPEIEDNKLITDFPSGVGEYFLAILGMIVNVVIISAIIFVGTVYIGKKLIGGFGISYTQFVDAAQSVEAMKAFVESLTNEQLIKINYWNLLFFCSVILNYFILILYPSVILFKEKNPYKALIINLKDTFGHRVFKNVSLFLIVFILYLAVSLFTALVGKNIFAHFVLTLVNFYYMTYVGVLIFNYYYSNFIKIGSNVDTTV